MVIRPPSPRFLFLSFFLYIFLVFFGLCESLWWERDEIQTYTIGLKCYTTHTWPFFGPDVNGPENPDFQRQLPGALEGLLIGLPFYLCPIPEAPFLLLGLLNILGVALLAWYIHRRLPALPQSWLMVWICVTPWLLEKCCHIINPAYDFFPSVLFFIGFLEALPEMRKDILNSFWANAAMGLGIFWIMQIHFSYVFLVPLAAYALYTQAREGKAGLAFGAFLCGAAPMVSLILPTWILYGFGRSDVASGFTSPFFLKNVLTLPTILARYLSLVCFEIPRYIAEHTTERIAFLTQRPWLLIPGFLLWAGGWVQALLLLLYAFKRTDPDPFWVKTRNLTFICFFLVYVSFWFTSKSPNSHIYLVFYPLIMFYSCYAWSFIAKYPKVGLGAKILVVSALYFQIGLAVGHFPNYSMYGEERPKVVQALQKMDFRIFHERRPGTLY